MMIAYTESESNPGVFYRQTLVLVSGRIHIACTCKAGQTRPGFALPCKHARAQLEEVTDRVLNQAPTAPGHDRNGRPIAPPNVSALVD